MSSVLLALVTLSVLSALVLCWLSISNMREARALQGQAAAIQNNRMFIANLANETVEYSKTHPAIEPILEGVGLKPGRTAAPAASAVKPATR